MDFTGRLAGGAVAFGVIAALVAISPVGAPRIAKKVEAASNRALSLGDFRWASARADGRRVTLYFSGGDPAKRSDAAASVAALAAVASVETIEIAPPAAPEPSTPEAAVAETETPPAPADAQGEPQADLVAASEPPIDAQIEEPPVADIEECRQAIDRVLVDQRLTFRADSTRLGAADIKAIESLAAAMETCAGLRIAVEGHTDATGPETTNLRISERRATAVAEILAPLRPDVEFIVKPYGEKRPIASNRTLAGRAANRRIDFAIEAPSGAESE